MARKFMKKKNSIKIDLANYPMVLQGIGGIGKTTTMTEMAVKEVGDEGYVLVTVGREPFAQHIGDIYNERCKDWDELEELIEDVCENKNTDYPDLRIMCFDSWDELFRIAEKQIVAEYNRSVDPGKRVKVVGATYGGFQRGENRVLELVISTIFKICDYGMTPWFIGHTKPKNQTDIYTGIEFERITSTLDNKYYTALKDKVSIVMCAYIEREMNDLETVKDAFSKKNKQVGKIASEKRVVSFRDEEYATDVKSHFKHIDPKCELDTDTIIKTIKDAIKKEIELKSKKPITENEITEMVKEEREEVVKQSEEFAEKQKEDAENNNVELKQEKLDTIKANLPKLDVAKLQEIMKDYEVKDFTNVEVISMKCLDAILELI